MVLSRSCESVRIRRFALGIASTERQSPKLDQEVAEVDPLRKASRVASPWNAAAEAASRPKSEVCPGGAHVPILPSFGICRLSPTRCFPCWLYANADSKMF